jgi:hypothetical protein
MPDETNFRFGTLAPDARLKKAFTARALPSYGTEPLAYAWRGGHPHVSESEWLVPNVLLAFR